MLLPNVWCLVIYWLVKNAVPVPNRGRQQLSKLNVWAREKHAQRNGVYESKDTGIPPALKET